MDQPCRQDSGQHLHGLTTDEVSPCGRPFDMSLFFSMVKLRPALCETT
jgi:hypothetical protein